MFVDTIHDTFVIFRTSVHPTVMTAIGRPDVTFELGLQAGRSCDARRLQISLVDLSAL